MFYYLNLNYYVKISALRLALLIALCKRKVYKNVFTVLLLVFKTKYNISRSRGTLFS